MTSLGLNLTRMVSKPNLYPASLSLPSIKSTASPLQPKEPNTPANLLLVAVERTIPKAVCTGVGACPPRVGEPMTKPADFAIAALISSGSVNSQLIDSTLTPAFVMPRAIACAKVAVLP